jgi:hypothetical protein
MLGPAWTVGYAAIVVDTACLSAYASPSHLRLHPPSPKLASYQQNKKQRREVCVFHLSAGGGHEGGYVFFSTVFDAIGSDRIGWVMIVMTRGAAGVYGVYVYIPFLRRMGFGMAFMGFFWECEGEFDIRVFLVLWVRGIYCDYKTMPCARCPTRKKIASAVSEFPV